MAKILVAFDTVSEGFEALTSEHEVIFPPNALAIAMCSAPFLTSPSAVT